jgi:hypothetical protein
MEQKSTCGIKETKEVLLAANELTLVIIRHVKDGVSVSDIPAIVSDLIASDSFKLALVDAVTGVTNVPAEIKDMDFSEGMELGKVELDFVPKVLEALKK